MVCIAKCPSMRYSQPAYRILDSPKPLGADRCIYFSVSGCGHSIHDARHCALWGRTCMDPWCYNSLPSRCAVALSSIRRCNQAGSPTARVEGSSLCRAANGLDSGPTCPPNLVSRAHIGGVTKTYLSGRGTGLAKDSIWRGHTISRSLHLPSTSSSAVHQVSQDAALSQPVT